MSSSVVFLDRDGVINHDSEHHIKSVEEWLPIPGSLEAMARLSRAGYRVVILTNQSGLARRLFTHADLIAIHDRLRAEVESRGGSVDGIFICPHGPDEGCPCRKPAVGLIEQAVAALGVNAAGAAFVGDRITDLEAARSAGCRPVYVGSTRDLAGTWAAGDPEIEVYPCLSDFVERILET